MAKSRHYQVVQAFPVRVKEEGKPDRVVRLTPRHAERVEDLLTSAQIKEHIAAGNLRDNGAVVEESASVRAESHVTKGGK